MKKKKFRAELYKSYIASGLQDHALTQEYINIAENFVFNDMKVTVSDLRALNEKIGASNNGSKIGSRAYSSDAAHSSNPSTLL